MLNFSNSKIELRGQSRPVLKPHTPDGAFPVVESAMLQYQTEAFQCFETFHEIMLWKVTRILLVSSPYQAWILGSDQVLAERIVHEYAGLNLTRPPRLTRVSSALEALEALEKEKFELVLTMPVLTDMDAPALGREIKGRWPEVAVVLMGQPPCPSHECYLEGPPPAGIDRVFAWTGNPEILLAIIKELEDRMNVAHDTVKAGIRVILFVEDSPTYLSSILPILYRELVLQTREVVDQGLIEEHRLLVRRARPKILLVQSYEEALAFYHQYEPYIMAVISDACFSRGGQPDTKAGLELLNRIHSGSPDIPLLLVSSESNNGARAKDTSADFVDKNSSTLHEEIRSFFMQRVGFGEFVFRTPDEQEISRAWNLKTFEEALRTIPEDSLRHHCRHNDPARWLFAHAEIELASRIRGLARDDFPSWNSYRESLVELIRATRCARNKRVIANFDPNDFDEFTEFAKIGKGSMGGKARGLAFMSSLLMRGPSLQERFPGVRITVPQTLIITTEAFDDFVQMNGLRCLAKKEISDEQVASQFLSARMPDWVTEQLSAYLNLTGKPIAVRSSGLLEDARFRAYAGLYKTYLLPNDGSDLGCRLEQLLAAVKLIYASTYFQGPKAFSRRVGNRTEDEKMGVILQPVCGDYYKDFFYPAISGVAQSYNYYPFAKMKPDDGVAVIALGLGQMVVQGDKTLRFSPKAPKLALQMVGVEEFLENAQTEFFALPLGKECVELGVQEAATLARRDVSDARNEFAVRLATSTYVPEENRLSESSAVEGYPVVSFAQVLKHTSFPLGEIISELLAIGRQGMGCPVEMEFSVDIRATRDSRPEFWILQVRPMSAREDAMEVEISAPEVARSFLVSSMALGNCENRSISDIVFVDPDAFVREATSRIAHEIGEINDVLFDDGRKYLLLGPGRWGSADRWLGIPVQWRDISAVGAIVEASFQDLRAEPSQGSHFFHNMTTLGINYITVLPERGDRIDWNFLHTQQVVRRTEYVTHVRLGNPMILKVDGRTARCAAYLSNGDSQRDS